MYSVLKSYGLNGLNGFAVAVEADVSGGLPAFSLVGLPDSAVRESGDRVRSAVKNLGYKWPDRHITVNLAPADIRKSGPVYDLPLLLAVLAASGQLEPPPKDTAFLGELALDGSLRPVSGVLPMALEAAASNRGRSYTGPVLRTSAGARLMVMRRSGHLKPRFFRAAWTRSPLSRTAESGRPTMERAGIPPEMSASTSTGKPLRPLRPKLLRTAYMGAPFCPMGRQKPSIKGDNRTFYGASKFIPR